MATLGERLRKAREAKGLTQIDVIKILGVKNSSLISNYECGSRDPDTSMLKRLAEIYEVSIDYLCDRTDDPKPPQQRTTETTAAHRTEDDQTSELPEEARKSLNEFEEFIRRKYEKREGD